MTRVPESRPGIVVQSAKARDVAGFGHIRVVAVPRRNAPFDVDAEVVEEDTHLVLSAAPEFQVVTEHPVRVMTEAFTWRGLAPGTVLVRKGPPLRFLAVVHDLSRDGATCCESWVLDALQNVLVESRRLGLASLGLPPLGGAYGGLDMTSFLGLLEKALCKTPVETLRRIWLILP